MSDLTKEMHAQVDGRVFRDVMGRFATGVTVVSTRVGADVHAMTANGFISLSLKPTLVGVSIGTCSKMHRALHGSGHFGVSFLATEQEKISRHFAGQPVADIDISFKEVAGVPILGDALAYVAARIVDAHPVGDHTLFVGEVSGVGERTEDPLLFYSGRYWRLHTPTRHSMVPSDTWSGFCLDPLGQLGPVG